ncbi:hypothetical protein GCM10009850_071990 [Nonomuraea monospora]|uniref:Cobalamin-independent methionine synthase MetE C-terminal/archaeal domain-containing protein n=1 Tax=Nonomuraea monospora TaxID=568818 RepID=A0ABP5PJH3_9ACTN
MSRRRVHLVGSYPAAGTSAAMTTIAEVAGPFLRSLPDGETGERSRWIVNVIDGLRDHPGLELVKDGDYSSYDSRPLFKVRRGHRLTPDSLRLGYANVARESYTVFRQVRAEHGLPEVSFQVGLPGDFDLAYFAFGAAGAVRLRGVVRAALAREIAEIAAWGGQDVVFQIEVPGELVLVEGLPRPLRAAAARALVRGLVKQAVVAPSGTRFGVHLCVGDLGNKALRPLGSASALVALVKALLRYWPQGRPLEYVHVPLAAGDQPPPLDENFYRGLSALAGMPSRVRFVAGLAHEGQDAGEQRAILERVERLLERPVDVASACGLGRRSPQDARRALERAAALAET